MGWAGSSLSAPLKRENNEVECRSKPARHWSFLLGGHRSFAPCLRRLVEGNAVGGTDPFGNAMMYTGLGTQCLLLKSYFQLSCAKQGWSNSNGLANRSVYMIHTSEIVSVAHKTS